MPRALTLEEKRERNMAKLEVNMQETSEVVRDESSRAVPEKQRRTRGVFNGTRGKLEITRGIPGYHLHWINDYPGRIDAALDNGYEFVSPDEVGKTSFNVGQSAEQIKHSVGSLENGDPLFAYLMKIRQEWWEEDQKNKSSREDKVDQAIRTGRNSTVQDPNETPRYYGEGTAKVSDRF